MNNRALRSARMALARRCRHSQEEWQALLASVAGCCPRCGRHGWYLERDHVIPIYQGGCDGAHNLQPLCARCNAQKGPEAVDWLAARGLRLSGDNERCANAWLQAGGVLL
jgi:5-methylcytosine-specific restriction endonuclease McrA